MNALDTNLLVRFLVNDDRKQAHKVKQLFETAERAGEVFMLTTVVALELIWVLSAVYECSRADILRALEQLCMLPIVHFENPTLIQRLISLGRDTTIELPDLLIGLAGQSLGCETTLTFDRKAAQSDLFRLP